MQGSDLYRNRLVTRFLPNYFGSEVLLLAKEATPVFAKTCSMNYLHRHCCCAAKDVTRRIMFSELAGQLQVEAPFKKMSGQDSMI